ncbi:unnamed protein product [Calypogeia fissa]
MQISQDPIVESGQRNVTFWDRVAQHYNGHRPTSTQERGARSLESKWGELKHDVAKFAGTYSTVEDLRIFGTNVEDTLQKAQELYVTKHPKGKSFAFTDYWCLLKDCPRFSQTVEDMNSKVNGKAKGKGKSTVDRVNSPSTPQQAPNQQTMSSSLDANEDISSIAQKRPIENKAAKKLKSDEYAFRVATYAQRAMAKISGKRLRILEEQNLQNLFTVQAADIDEECREFFQLCRSRELDKFKKQMHRGRRGSCADCRTNCNKDSFTVPFAQLRCSKQ